MVAHADLTGSDLHEPKGVASAAAKTVYVATGSGSGAWQKIETDQLDTSSFFNTNTFFLNVSLADVSTASSVWIPIPVACTLVKVTSTLQTAITIADSVLTFFNNAGTSMGSSMTIAFSGSASGDVDTYTPSSNNTFSAGQMMKITTDGGSTTTSVVWFTLEFTRTA